MQRVACRETGKEDAGSFQIPLTFIVFPASQGALLPDIYPKMIFSLHQPGTAVTNGLYVIIRTPGKEPGYNKP